MSAGIGERQALAGRSAGLTPTACQRTAAVTCAIALLMLAAAAMPSPSGARTGASAPKLLQGSYVANYFVARPALMSFYSPIARTFTSYITAPGITRSEFKHGRTGSIRWTESDRTARGTGEEWDDNCSPNCDRGTFEPVPVTLRAWRVRRGRYTRLSVTLHPPRLRPLTFAYSLLLTRRRYLGSRLYYWGTRTTVAGA